MIVEITWEQIHDIWRNKLWPDRVSPIQKNSAMCFLQGHNMYNSSTLSSFFGYNINDIIVGVNSGHGTDNGYRSRGLWVNPEYRGLGIGQQLLLATIKQAVNENYNMIWSVPRYTSWNTYKNFGFELASDWFKTETSDQNAFCIHRL